MAGAQDRPARKRPEAPGPSVGLEHSAARSEFDIIERTRRLVMNNIAALPNFICRRVSRQAYDRSGVGAKWSLVRTVVAAMAFGSLLRQWRSPRKCSSLIPRTLVSPQSFFP